MSGGSAPECDTVRCPALGCLTRDGRRQVVVGNVSMIAVSRNSGENGRKILNPIALIDRCTMLPGKACRAVVAHEGHNVNSGHWLAFIKSNGQWWRVDTARARPELENPFRNQVGQGQGHESFTLDILFFW